MKSSNTEYLPKVDHLRLFAALLVFGFHFFHHYAGGWQARPDKPWLGMIVEGHTGVALFFVLSGFIFMTIALRGGALAYGGFLRNRALRILPLFLFVFFVAISIGRDRFVPGDVLYLLFTNLGLAPTSWHFATGPAWSISVEVTFYLVFPFLARFTIERGPGYLAGLLLLLLLVKAGAHAANDKSTHMFYSTLIGRFDQFVWGMCAAIAHQRLGPRIRAAGLLPLAMSILAVGTAVWLQAAHASFFLPSPRQAAWIWWSSVEGVVWGALIVTYLAAPHRLPGPIDRTLRPGGEWSYSFYMWHTMVIFVVHHYAGFLRPTGLLAADLAANGLLLLVLCLAVARLSYRVIEEPFLRMRSRYVAPATSAALPGPR